MLLELDSDQRLWGDTVRDAAAKECPSSLVRSVAEDTEGAVDTSALWRTYVDMGWTELTESTEMVELGILIEELGRATDPAPFLATMTQFTPAPGRLDRAPEVTFDSVPVGQDDRVVRHGRATQDGGDADRAYQVALTGLAPTMVGASQGCLIWCSSTSAAGSSSGWRSARSSPSSTRQPICTWRSSGLAHCRTSPRFPSPPTIRGDGRRPRWRRRQRASVSHWCSATASSLGAMGFTWENNVQFALTRAKAGEFLLGGAAHHRALITEWALARTPCS